MRYLLLSFCLIWFSFESVAQNTAKKYDFDKVKFECPPSTQEIKDLYTTGFAALKSGENTDIAGKIFLNITTKDESMCDAYFWIGVCLTEMKKEKNAVLYYYYADSLSVKSNLIFKRELAEAGIRTGLLGLADQKYNELIQDFPNEVEGYIGLGVVATSNGNIKDGLDNLAIAERKLNNTSPLSQKQRDQIELMYGILYVQQEDFLKAITHLDNCKKAFWELDDWNANYAWTAYNLYMQNKELRWKLESEKALERIQNKAEIKASFLNRFIYD